MSKSNSAHKNSAFKSAHKTTNFQKSENDNDPTIYLPKTDIVGTFKPIQEEAISSLSRNLDLSKSEVDLKLERLESQRPSEKKLNRRLAFQDITNTEDEVD